MATVTPSTFGPMMTAMVTPFTPDGAVDHGRAEQLVARLIENGTTTLVVCGTTGESPTLTPEEKLELFRLVKRVAGNTPVIATTGDNETAFSIELSKQAEQCGVDGLLLVVPYYNRPSQEGLYRHFSSIAGAVQLPCIVYNIPGRTGRNLDAPTIARLSQVPNIVANKEASGNLEQISHGAAATAAANPDFLMYSGNDGDTLLMLPLGCAGCISVISHIAGLPYRQMLDAYWKGDIQTAREIHFRLLPVVDALFPSTTSNPVPIKAALQLQGFDCGGLRLPLVEATASERENLRVAMDKAGLL